MITKEIIVTLLLLGTLQIFATDSQDGISYTINQDFPNKKINNFKTQEEVYKKKFEDVALQFQKDYKAWGDKKYPGSDFKESRSNSNHLRYNQIDSKEYNGKHKKYGDMFNQNTFNDQKDKPFHEERVSENKEQEKPGSLFLDVNVNNFNNKKEVSGDSEVVSDIMQEKPGSLLHDINVNYVNNNKEVSGDSEVISNKVLLKNKEKYQENYQNGNELYMKRFKKDFYQNLIKLDLTNPPPPNDTILMARYILHNVDWAALGTLSTRSSTKGSPFVCLKATSDGMKNASSGIPFFYMSSMDLCTQDLEKDNRVSVLVTLSETEYCKEHNLDPQDPRCAKLTFSGKIKKIKAGSDEEKFAKNALFSRHPAMMSWPADHHFYFTKLKIGQIILLDQFGGAIHIKVKDYLNGKSLEPEMKKK